MPPKGWKSINVTENEFRIIEKIAERKKWSLKTVVLDALENTYPEEFKKE